MGARLIWLVADALPAWALRRAWAEGRLPALARLAADGLVRTTRPPHPNCQTPPSLASLFTGREPDDHGITGFRVPVPGAGLHASRSAFALAPRGELVWESVGAAGGTSALMQAPWAVADDVDELPLGCRVAVDGYGERACRGEVLEGADVGSGGDSAADHSTSTTLAQTSSPWWTWPGVPGADRRARRAVRDDGRELTLLSGAGTLRVRGAADVRDVVQRHGPFVGEGMGRAYRSGQLGRLATDGGDGTAEALLADSIAESARSFARLGHAALLAAGPVDLAVLYQPCVDDAGHELAGHALGTGVGHDIAWNGVRSACELVDRQLATLRRSFPDATVVVSSDHGMAAVRARLHVNEALVAAGLAAWGPDARLDAERTAVAYHAVDDGSLVVHDERFAGGSVARRDAPELIARAAAALEGLRDPSTRTRVVERVLPRPEAAIADAVVVAAEGIQPTDRRAGTILSPSPKSGGHLVRGDDPNLDGILLAAGPGVSPLDVLDRPSNADIAPLVLAWLQQAAPCGTAVPLTARRDGA